MGDEQTDTITLGGRVSGKTLRAAQENDRALAAGETVLRFDGVWRPESPLGGAWTAVRYRVGDRSSQHPRSKNMHRDMSEDSYTTRAKAQRECDRLNKRDGRADA